MMDMFSISQPMGDFSGWYADGLSWYLVCAIESRRRRVRTVHLVIPFTKGAAVLPRRALHRDLLLHTVPIFPPNRSLEGWNAHAQESRDMLTAYFLITCPVVPT